MGSPHGHEMLPHSSRFHVQMKLDLTEETMSLPELKSEIEIVEKFFMRSSPSQPLILREP